MVTVALHEMTHAYLMNLYLKGELIAINPEYYSLLKAFIAFYENQTQDIFDTQNNELHNINNQANGTICN